MGLLKTQIIGNLTRDPKSVQTQNGKSFVAFSVAVNQGSGQYERTDYVEVAVFGNQDDACMRFLSKGRQVYCDGDLELRSYDKKDGSKGYSLNLRASNVQFLGSKDDRQQSEQQPVDNSNQSTAMPPNAPSLDEIPF